MAPLEIQNIVNKAWEARYSQDLESCHSYLAEVKQCLGFPIGGLTLESIRNHFDRLNCASPSTELVKLHLQCLLLSASLARSEEGVEQAERYVESAFEVAHAWGIRNIFELSFQKGLNFSARGDFSSALEAFVVSRLATRDLNLKAMALFNSYACLLHLGLCYEKTFTELKETLAASATKSPPSYLQNIMDQVSMAQAKEEFYQGRFSEVMQKKSRSPFTQLDYFKLWIESLPYTPSYKPAEELELETLVMAYPQFFQKSYRLRTLQGLLHPTDLQKAVPLEQIDRIYLWTWRWLIDPHEFPVTKILPLFDGLDFSLLHKSSTNEDHQLLSNALSWLSLFSPVTAKLVDQMLGRIHPPVTKSAFLEFEGDCIKALKAKRDQRTQEFMGLKETLKANPLWCSSEHFLTKLFQAITEDTSCPQHLAKAARNLKKMLQPSEVLGDALFKGIVVDEGLEQIYSSELGKSFQSEIMICALRLLHQKGSVTCEEFLSSCFGIGSYDAFIHDPKIYNLLARVRALNISDLRFGVKSGKVYAIGSWAQVRFIRPAGSGYDLDQKSEWRNFISARAERTKEKAESKSNQWIRPQLLLRQLAHSGATKHKSPEALVPGEFNRADVERVAGVSRATANRILKS